MGNYIYNGVELPPLPEWDKETYPYAVIWNNAGVGIYLQALPAKPLTTAKTVRDETIDYIEMETSGTYLTYWEGSNGWGYSGDATSEGAISIRTSLVLWANFDILNSDGTLYLAASEPIPVSTWKPDPISMVMGWLVGRRLAGQRGKVLEPVEPEEPSGEIVGYLYNGVQLPDINTVWTDKETYPYAVIFDGTEAEGLPYCLVFTDSTVSLISNGDNIGAAVGGDFYYSTDGSSWISAGEYGTEVRDSAFIWTSHDILNTDGTVYLAASEPVPVYE